MNDVRALRQGEDEMPAIRVPAFMFPIVPAHRAIHLFPSLTSPLRRLLQTAPTLPVGAVLFRVASSEGALRCENSRFLRA